MPVPLPITPREPPDWKDLANPPKALQRLMNRASWIGGRTDLLSFTIERSFIKVQTEALSFPHHPLKRNLGQGRFVGWVTAAYVRMYSCEIDIFHILTNRSRRHQVLPKCRATFINRDSVADMFDLWIVRGMWKRAEVIYVADRSDGIPNTDEMNWASSTNCRFEIRTHSRSWRVRAKITLPISQRIG